MPDTIDIRPVMRKLAVRMMNADIPLSQVYQEQVRWQVRQRRMDDFVNPLAKPWRDVKRWANGLRQNKSRN